MTIFLYYLSFLPLVLAVLAIHEFGHLAAARLCGVRVSAFQIGFGRKLLSLQTGRTAAALTPQTAVLGPGGRRPRQGEQACVYVTRGPDGGYTATALLPEGNWRRFTGEERKAVLRQNEEHLQLRGRVREIDGQRVVLADMTWSLHLVPLMAGVSLPEDPGRGIGDAYNLASWPRRMLIILAGPLANLALLTGVILALAAFPITGGNSPTLAVERVIPGSPAELAGFRTGDRIIEAGTTLMPGGRELRNALRRAGEAGRGLDVQVMRRQETLALRVKPSPETGRAGLELTELVPPEQSHSMAPRAMGQRLNNLGEAYFGSIASLLGGGNTGASEVSGLLLGMHQTAQAVEYAGLKAWLAVLGAVTMSVALLNLLPVPPLDGYQMATQTLQALRRGKPISARADRAMTFCGMMLILLTGTYLLLSDILDLLEG